MFGVDYMHSFKTFLEDNLAAFSTNWCRGVVHVLEETAARDCLSDETIKKVVAMSCIAIPTLVFFCKKIYDIKFRPMEKGEDKREETIPLPSSVSPLQPSGEQNPKSKYELKVTIGKEMPKVRRPESPISPASWISPLPKGSLKNEALFTKLAQSSLSEVMRATLASDIEKANSINLNKEKPFECHLDKLPIKPNVWIGNQYYADAVSSSRLGRKTPNIFDMPGPKRDVTFPSTEGEQLIISCCPKGNPMLDFHPKPCNEVDKDITRIILPFEGRVNGTNNFYEILKGQDFQTSLEKADEFAGRGKEVVIHCALGRDRSVGWLLFWLTTRSLLSKEEVHSMIANVRNDVNNLDLGFVGFISQFLEDNNYMARRQR